MTTQPTVPIADDLATQFQIRLAYETVAVGLQYALSEIAAETRLPAAARRMVLTHLLVALPHSRKLELAGQLVDLGDKYIKTEAHYDLADNPAVSGLYQLGYTAATEVLATASRVVGAHQQLTGGVR